MLVPLLTNLHIYPDEENEGSWISVEDFLKFLRQHHTSQDVIKEIKKSNVVKEFNGHRNGVKMINDSLSVSLNSSLRYIFHHADQLGICREVTDQVLSVLLGTSRDCAAVSSIKELYCAIAKTSVKKPHIEAVLLQNVEFKEDIPTLYEDYKADFSPLDWKKICVFEHHFSRQHLISTTSHQYSYEDLVRLRWKFFHSWRQSADMGSEIFKVAKDVMYRRIKRRNAAELDEMIHIHAGGKLHIPTTLDVQLLQSLPEGAVNKVICVDCTQSCKHPQCIHIYVEMNESTGSASDQNFTDNIEYVRIFLRDHHGTECWEAVFLDPNALDDFTGQDGKIARFSLRDAVHAKLMSDKTLHYWTSEEQHDLFEDMNHSEQKCTSCFDENPPNPLHWKSFKIFEEWLLDVPLFLQNFLECFINSASLNRSGNHHGFLKPKFLKLYSYFDALLALNNRNYAGLLQEMNTEELSMNYHSASTVFSITSSAGATVSLNTSERRLKKKADSDLVYYNTYLKKYKLEYTSSAGKKEEMIGLRDCILILMMDNLVRLKYHNDPDPGESRSLQVCTLPITLKGVPRDAVEVDAWHDASCCDGTDTCPCKGDTLLTRQDVDTKLLNLLPAEESCLKRFKQLCTWGMKNIWTSLVPEGKSFLFMCNGVIHVCLHYIPG